MWWKAIFFVLLAAIVGLLWQHEEYREMLVRELNTARTALNGWTSRYEGWQVVFVTCGVTLMLSSVYSMLFRDNIYTLRQRAAMFFFRAVRKLPGIQAKIQRELGGAISAMEKEYFSAPNIPSHTELPSKGLTHKQVMSEVDKMEKMVNIKWKEGWVSGGLYYSSPELTKLSTAVFEKFVWTNPLHVDVFPQICRMEAEVVQWTVNLFHGSKDACGVMTSGGTESIMLAMRAYRAEGYRRGIEFPEIICPTTAHAAFRKAAEYFRMKMTLVPTDPRTMMVDLKAMARAISSNTVVLVGSAPQFPHGVIDPVEPIARLALKHGVGMHVDSCLGGFILPFMEAAGYTLEPFDFRVRGVTSISADTHKYGYTPKGTSVLMYSNKQLRHGQYFVDPNWEGGIYATANIGGSRPGCLIATTWATLLYMGMDGYVDATRRIIHTTRYILKELDGIPGIHIMGRPQAMVFAIGSADFNIFRLAPPMREKGWSLNVLQFPASIHLCVTMVHTREGVADRFVQDVRECVKELMRDPKAKATGDAAMYGMAASVPDRSVISELANEYLDLVYKATPPTTSPAAAADS